MKLSVVVPTYNNAQILPECLRRIYDQSLPRNDYEVIVIDDSKTGLGPAATRNKGVAKATASVVVFIQDDILVDKDFLERHWLFHQEHLEKAAVLVGLTVFDEQVMKTPFMKWLENGHQFKYQVSDKPYLNFYTPNLSLKKEFILENGGFDESLFVPGGVVYEDTELGYRLWEAGMKLYFNSDIKVLHHHFKSLESVCRLRYLSGKTARLLYKKHPELQKVFRDDLKTKLTTPFVNNLTIRLLEPPARWCETRLNFGLLFWLVCRYHYNRGYMHG